MIIVRKKHKHSLDEMSRHDIQTAQDNLPFRVVVQIPDHNPPHAYLFEKNEKAKEGYADFLIPPSLPKKPSDIKDYRVKMSEEDRELLFRWLSLKSKRDKFRSNYELMVLLWSFNTIKYI